MSSAPDCLSSVRQVLLALVHLRCRDACARLAAGFGIGAATACRCIREAVQASPIRSGGSEPHRRATARGHRGPCRRR
ncbi:transposase family protein [Streptomyces sp. NPDC060366]|uniref:transposase family protein n=1 Tax=Streptomyces sp. NPDC060366 TaxID=3347105 RepID=UPI0036514770